MEQARNKLAIAKADLRAAVRNGDPLSGHCLRVMEAEDAVLVASGRESIRQRLGDDYDAIDVLCMVLDAKRPRHE